ncbi:MAG TPA: zinc-dependent alcohol dehydrogenase [Polyangiaceae bacterium]|nr:zinc-dependent alcohol dehydrogenase [Polyangiaceae bacterium]
MLATSYLGKGRIRVEQKPEPRIEHPNDVILRVTRTAICGSDLHLLHGLVPDTRVGSTFGHEFAGVVEEVGPSVASLMPGDRVVVPFNVACGTCFYCQRGLTSCCDNSNPCSSIGGGAFGYSHTTGGYEGGQAERVRVPFADIGPMKIPHDMHEEDVLFLSDILPTGYQAAEMGAIKPGETVVVFGCGPVGLFAQKAAMLQGAGRVIAVDQIGYRLEKAKTFTPGVETIDFSETKDVVGRIRALTDGRGADVCIDCVGCEAQGNFMHTLLGKLMLEAGSATAIQWAIDSARRGGNVVLVGVYGPPFNLVNIGTAMNKGLTLRMAQCNVKRYMPTLLDHIRAGRIDAKSIISHRFPLEEAELAYHVFDNKLDDCIKCVLIPPEAA